MNSTLVILGLLPGLIILVSIIYGLKQLSKKILSGKTLKVSSIIPTKIELEDESKKIIVSIVVYLVLLVLIRELQPDIWNWIWQKDQLFWLIQLTILGIALIFALGPTWTRWIIFPILILVLTTHILREIEKDVSENQTKTVTEQCLVFKPQPYSEKELRIFLENSEPPRNLKRAEKKKRIKNLHKVFAEKVNAVNWSSTVVLPTPPSKKILYRLETVVLSGKVLIKNGDSVVGKYPDKNFEILDGKHFSLRFKSLNHLETAVVVWMWEEHLP